MNKKVIYISSIITVIIAVGLTFALLFYNGILLFNNPSKDEYPVRGVDVSAYQGKIDWAELSEQSIDFAFIKATEGSGFTDKCFEYNYKNAIKTDLRVGAYHFFSFDSEGKTQAENFINSVYEYEDMLPPVIDVEFYGDYSKNSPPKDIAKVKKDLKILLDTLTDKYGRKPIIYATDDSYEVFIKGDFDEYDIWIRDIFNTPRDPDDWVFWQYTNRGRLDGYNGDEEFIDINVFKGTKRDFENYGKRT